MAWQYDRPDQSDGIIQVFRQPRSPCETARLELGGLADNLIYTFDDADTGETVQIASETLAQDGLLVHLPHKRSSRLLFYTCREIVH